MHLIDSYSFQSGQEIDKIWTFEKYYPIPFDNYIVIQPWSKPSKNYSFWEEVIELISPILQKNNIKIVQVGAKDEKPLKNCFTTQGTTSFGQLEYIISRAKAVLSTDSISSHLAGHYGKPLVCLISNNYKNCVKPYFNNGKNQIILEPDRTNKKPSFQLDEGQNKQIDEIPPEEIAKSILTVLKMDFNYPYNSISIGKLYTNKILESACDCVVDVKKIGAENIVMRLDINNNFVVLQNQLNLNGCQIVTDSPIPEQIIKNYRKNILGIVYKITEKHHPDFIKMLIEEKIGYQLISELPPEKLNPIKLDYMDFSVIHQQTSEAPDFFKDINFNKLYIKTAKVLLSNGKFYNCYQNYINGLDFNPQINEPTKVSDKNLNLLWLENQFCMFLEKN